MYALSFVHVFEIGSELNEAAESKEHVVVVVVLYLYKSSPMGQPSSLSSLPLRHVPGVFHIKQAQLLSAQIIIIISASMVGMSINPKNYSLLLLLAS